MQVPGLIGGISPESTVDYYKQILEAYRRLRPDGSQPPLLIKSLDLKAMVALDAGGRLAELAAFLSAEFDRLARAGADFGALTANTPHVVFEEVQNASPIPLVSIVHATRDEAVRIGAKRLALFGTRFTMEGRFYPDVFAAAGLAIVRPAADEETFIHDHYMGELVLGVFRPEVRERVRAIARTLVARDGVDGVILGGTELPILLKGAEPVGVPFLDTTAIHVARIVDRILS